MVGSGATAVDYIGPNQVRRREGDESINVIGRSNTIDIQGEDVHFPTTIVYFGGIQGHILLEEGEGLRVIIGRGYTKSVKGETDCS